MSKGKIVFWIVTLLIVAGFTYWVWNHWRGVIAQRQAAAAQQGGGPMPVQAAHTVRRDVIDYYDFTGTTQAVDAIEVRARVEGYLQEIHFTDGDFVEKGQLLFTIEPASFIAQRDEAAARLKAAQAEEERARLDYERMQEATKTNAVSQQDLSRSEAAYRTAQAAVTEATAALERARLNLSYTEIRSPISGRVGRHLVDAGNLVGAGERTLLTTVVQVEPIYVFFYVGEDLLQKPFLRTLLAGGSNSASPLLAGLSGDTGYPYEGQIRYIDNTVDPMTGTIFVRGILPNEGRELLPGMFMRVRVSGDVRKNAVLVRETAIQTDLSGRYVLVIGDNNILERRTIQLGRSEGALRVVTEGLSGEEAYVLSGLHMVRPGMPVQPIFVDGPAGSGGALSAPGAGGAADGSPSGQNP